MYLSEEASKLTHEEKRLVLLNNERTLMNMVPDRLENTLRADPPNKVWLLRPEAQLDGQSKLVQQLGNPQ